MAIDEADEDFEDEEAYLSILHEGRGEQPVQESAGKRRQHVTALEAHGDLQASRKKKAGNRKVPLRGLKCSNKKGMQAEKKISRDGALPKLPLGREVLSSGPSQQAMKGLGMPARTGTASYLQQGLQEHDLRQPVSVLPARERRNKW